MPIIVKSKRFYEAEEPKELDHLLACIIRSENFLGDQLLKGELDRIVYASDKFVFRARQNQNNKSSDLGFPFMNHYIDEIDHRPNENRWQYRSFQSGIFLPEVKALIKVNPININMESTIFFSSEKEMNMAWNKLRWISDGNTHLNAEVQISETVPEGEDQPEPYILPFPMDFEFTKLIRRPNYKDTDFLERDGVYCIKMDYLLKTLMFVSDSDISITEKSIFEFTNRKGVDTFVEYIPEL